MKEFELYGLGFLILTTSVYGRRVGYHRRHMPQANQGWEVVAPAANLNGQSNSYILPTDDKEFEYKITHHKDYDEIQPIVASGGFLCTSTECAPGHICRVDNFGVERCMCAPERSCRVGHSLVCGSDGNLYDSHCELHRTACTTGIRISVDKSGEACIQKDLWNQKMKPTQNSVDAHVISKKKDLSRRKEEYNKNPFLPVTRSATATTGVVSQSTTESPFIASEQCDWEKFEEFKDLLELHHCNRLAMIKCNQQGISQRRSLVMAMFKYYDRDSDTLITRSELEYAQHMDHIERLALVCSLPDIIRFSVRNEKDRSYIDSTTFLDTFGIRSPDRAPPLITFSSTGDRVTAVTADGYEGAELICPLTGTTDIGWKRNGIVLDLGNTDGYTLMSAGRLYISSLNLAHTGNYTCFHLHQPNIYQTQHLTVQVKPVIRTLDMGNVMEGVTTPLRCHSDGVPEPKAEWQVAQYGLPDDKMRYDWSNENTTVYILSPHVDYDSAEYECLAKSTSGWSMSKSKVLVQKKSVFAKGSSRASKGQYVVFHADGYTSYEADHCYTTHFIDKHSSDFTHYIKGDVDTLSRLCDLERPCEWGSVVNVNDNVIYAAQPSLYRVVVIDTRNNMRPKYVIPLNTPVKSIHYVVGTDELWILTGNQPQFQTIMVLSDASRGYPINIHPLLPEHTVFDSVEQIFVPPLNSFNYTSRYVWSTTFNQFSLNRIDTVSMSAKGHVELMHWNCSPQRVHYLAIGGLLLVECQSSVDSQTNLLVDSITNQVIREFKSGRIYVSPNTRYIVVVNPPRSLTIYHLEDDGSIQFMRDHKVEIDINTVSFMDSKTSSGFDLAITSPDENSVLFMDVKTTKTQVLEGLLSGRELTTPKSDAEHLVATSGEFGYHILLPSRGALFIVNKQYHLISCEWTDVVNMQRSVWVYI